MNTEPQSVSPIPSTPINRRQFIIRGSASISGILLVAGSGCTPGAPSEDQEPNALWSGFLDPPARARPGAYWVWTDGTYDLDQITRELEDLKQKGLSGLEIFDIAARDDHNIVPDGPAFMSEAAIQGYAHAIREATRLGLEMGFITSSSWNAGGPWVTPETGSKALYASETTVTGNGGIQTIALPYPEVPEPAFQGIEDGLRPWSDEEVYSEDVAVLAIPKNTGRVITAISDVIDLTDQVQADGALTWNAPAGSWAVLRIVSTNNRERLRLPSPNSDGYMIDHLSAEATEAHFRHIIDGLRQALGSFEESALTYLYLPSYEVRGLTEWTPTFETEFARRRGYQIRPFLPILFGWTITNREVSERFDHDRRLTVSDLLIENHYAKAAEVCHAAGLKVHAEAGGPGPPLHDFPAEALRALSVLDVPRGEFWVRDAPGADDPANVIKAVASAAHIYGGQIAEMESFTGWNHWERVPFQLKPYADRVFCEGVNRFVFHTYPHNPPAAGTPGWAYFAGTHVGVSRAWWPMAAPFISYLARTSYLLQEGLFVADVCFFYGHDAPLFVPNKGHDENTSELDFGYDYDYINTEVLLERVGVEGGRIVLPDGLSYAILVLPDRDDMSLEVLEKIASLVEQGATVVGRRPTRTPGLYDSDHEQYLTYDAELQRIADALWDDGYGNTSATGGSSGGRVLQDVALNDLLKEHGIPPDFSYESHDPGTELDYIHRRIGEDDVYFIANTRNQWERVDATFRVKDVTPELWEPDTAERLPLLIYDDVPAGTRVQLHLAPLGSACIVFKPGRAANPVVGLERDGERLFPAQAPADGRPSVTFRFNEAAQTELVAWSPGTYRLHTVAGQTLVAEGPASEASRTLEGPWHVRFQEGWGAPAAVVFPSLIDWTDHPDAGIRYYSGIAEYRKTLEIPAAWAGGAFALEIDLGEVHGVAEIFLNDQPVGITWKAPFAVDLSAFARPGENELQVRIANVWANRMLGDRVDDAGQQYTSSNIPPDVQRSEPVPSGLLGPVRLHRGTKQVYN